MLYRASDTIVAEHPELADHIRSVDAYLHDRQGQLFRLEPTADLLDIEPKALERLLDLCKAHEIVELVKVSICPEDDVILEADEDDALFCDTCDTIYEPDDCETEIAYRPRPTLPTVLASSAPLFTEGHALLIGVSAYHNLRRLGKTTSDAKDLYALLTDPACAGYPPTNVALLLDEQVTKAAISDKLDWLACRAGPEDTVAIFFSGHGAQRVGGFEPGEYLCPVEADWYNLRSTAISTDEFTNALRAIRAGRVVVFLDACHSGGVGEPKEAAPQVKAGLSEDTYARLAEGRGRVIVASCRPDEVSWELPEMRNGLFTHYLLEALRGAAVSADGTVRIFDLFDYVSQRVPQHKPQHPLFKGEMELNFAIALAGGKPTLLLPEKPTRDEPVMMPSQDRVAEYRYLDTPALQGLLKDVRRNLELLLQQAVAYGGERFVPLHIQNQLNTTRDDITALETVLAERSSLNERQIRCLEYLRTHGQITRRQYNLIFSVESMKANRELGEMVAKGFITRIGKGRSVYYVLAS